MKKLETNIPTNYGTDATEFKQNVGRYPKNMDELKDFAYCMKKGMDAQLDWGIIAQVAGEQFKD